MSIHKDCLKFGDSKLAMCFDESACELGNTDCSQCDECSKYKRAYQQEVEDFVPVKPHYSSDDIPVDKQK
jgi:hypothetical protein